MIWLAPIAWIGAAAIASPIVIHLLARPRPAVQPFPTLRFVPAVASVAVRRRRIAEIALLAVRCAIVAAAAAALAGPLAITGARRAAWNARVFREIVDAADGPIRAGLGRAIAKLDVAPPGRQEIVVRSSFPIGSLDDSDVAAVPDRVGLQFVRTRTLPASRDVEAPPVLREAVVERRQVTLHGAHTSVRDIGSSPAAVPIAILARDDAQRALDAVLAERVLAPPPGRRAYLLVADAPTFSTPARRAAPVTAAWIGDAIVRITRDEDLQAVTGRLDAALTDPEFARRPWLPIARNRGGSIAVAAATDPDGRLLVATATPSDSFATAVLIRSILNALAPPTPPPDDVVAIDDGQLRAWSREPGEAVEPRRDTVDEDDRRALWLAVLVLIGAEAWMRRTR